MASNDGNRPILGSKIYFPVDNESAGKSWTYVKFVCSQPFNKNWPFGITFLALRGSTESCGSEVCQNPRRVWTRSSKKKITLLSSIIIGEHHKQGVNPSRKQSQLQSPRRCVAELMVCEMEMGQANQKG